MASKENIRSSKSGAKDEEWRQRKTAAGAGVNCALSLEDQLLMMLMCLHLGQTGQELAYTFGINVSTVLRTIIAWLNLFVPSLDLGCCLSGLKGCFHIFDGVILLSLAGYFRWCYSTVASWICKPNVDNLLYFDQLPWSFGCRKITRE